MEWRLRRQPSKVPWRRWEVGRAARRVHGSALRTADGMGKSRTVGVSPRKKHCGVILGVVGRRETRGFCEGKLRFQPRLSPSLKCAPPGREPLASAD